jgi:hypothetical protein
LQEKGGAVRRVDNEEDEGAFFKVAQSKLVEAAIAMVRLSGSIEACSLLS